MRRQIEKLGIGESKMKSRRKKIALLVPSSNTVMENDLHSALPKDRYTVHTDRMFLVETTRASCLRSTHGQRQAT
jgi:maleate cis-trans isomerase